MKELTSLEELIKWFETNGTLSGVYKITSPTDRFYVGCTDDFLERFRTYRFGGNKNQKKIHRSLKKYGPENHKFEILEVVSDDDKEALNIKLGEREIYWGLLYNVLDKENLTLKLGRRTTIFSQETKDQIGETQRIKNLNGKPVLQYTDEGEFIKEWPSIKAAVLGITGARNGGGITSCCRGIVPRAYGFIWRLKHDNKIEGFEVTSRKVPILQYSLDGKFIKEWESATEASRNIGCSTSSIFAACKNIQGYSNGFIWMYKKGKADIIIKPYSKPGKVVNQYKTLLCKRAVEDMAYETDIGGHKALVINLDLYGSETFGERFKQYPVLCTYAFDGEKYSLSFYSDKQNKDAVDVSLIAKEHGGGGHKNAAGCTLKELFFKKVS